MLDSTIPAAAARTVLLFTASALAGIGLAAGAESFCQRHACSDDTVPVRGNEEIRFTPPANSEWIEVGLT